VFPLSNDRCVVSNIEGRSVGEACEIARSAVQHGYGCISDGDVWAWAQALSEGLGSASLSLGSMRPCDWGSGRLGKEGREQQYLCEMRRGEVCTGTWELASGAREEGMSTDARRRNDER